MIWISRQSFIDPGLSWKDLDWFKNITNSGFFPPIHDLRLRVIIQCR